MTGGPIHQENIKIILNVYVSNDRTSKYMKQKQIERRNRQIRNYSRKPHHSSVINKTKRQKISEDIEVKNTINKLSLIDINRTFRPTAAEYTFFSTAHRTCTKANHMYAHKSKS